MVFAKGLPVRIYGEGKGKVTVNFAGKSKTLMSEEDVWQIEFEPMEYGGPYSMEVIFENETKVLEDIHIGEVFLFAGQSNMQFKMKESNTPSNMYESNENLRMFSTDRIVNPDRFSSDDGWVICKKDEVPDWSAIGYLTANEISKTKNIAVGIVVCYQGASTIESWVPKGTFENMGINIPLDEKYSDHTNENYSIYNGDGFLYSYAFSQVCPFSFTSAIWYQGESDTTEAEGHVYCDELSALINIWRRDLQNKKLPFVVVQIADNANRGGIGWSLVQKAQVEISERLPNVKTVISKDVCENDDIHPKTKDKLSKRISETLLTTINIVDKEYTDSNKMGN